MKLILSIFFVTFFVLSKGAQAAEGLQDQMAKGQLDLSQEYQPAEGNIGGAFGAHINQTQNTDKISGSIGMILHGDLDPKSSLELSVFHQNKRSLLFSSGDMLLEERQVLHFSMGYRYWWKSWWSTSLGIYSAYPFGIRRIIKNDFSSQAPESSLSRSSTYGIDIAMQFHLLNKEASGPMLDFRYSMPFRRALGESIEHWAIFIGWNILFQEGQRGRSQL